MTSKKELIAEAKKIKALLKNPKGWRVVSNSMHINGVFLKKGNIYLGWGEKCDGEKFYYTYLQNEDGKKFYYTFIKDDDFKNCESPRGYENPNHAVNIQYKKIKAYADKIQNMVKKSKP